MSRGEWGTVENRVQLSKVGQDGILMPHSFPKGEMPAEIKWGRPPGLRGTPSSRSCLEESGTCDH